MESNNTKHTPGPWAIDKRSASIKILSKQNETLCSIYLEGNAINNARLIAAAPDLLEALKTLAYVVGYSYRDTPALAAAKAAIEKAEGGSK